MEKLKIKKIHGEEEGRRRSSGRGGSDVGKREEPDARLRGEEERGNSLCAIKKDRNALCAPEKVQRSSVSLLQLFFALHATAIKLGPNDVKLQVWKVENTLKSKYIINFFSILTTSNGKTQN